MRAVIAIVVLVCCAGCGGSLSPAAEFCGSYDTVMTNLVAAAGRYEADPKAFTDQLDVVTRNLGDIRARAPDQTLRTAFDKASFTLEVFRGSPRGLADFLTRADFAGNAVVIACADYGVAVNVR